MQVVQYGLYNVSDTYFEDFESEYFADNKNENRPYYLSYQDDYGIIWLIPISSQVENYKNKIKRDEEKYGGGKCIFYYLAKIAGKEHAFLIGSMFPVTEKYIKKPYTISQIHYVVKNKNDIANIQKRANKYLSLVKYGKLKSKINIMEIKEALLNKGS